jgi:leucyl aminopeptidase
MLQLDMTMFPTKSNPDVGIVTDFTDPALSQLLRTLVPVYTTLKSKDFKCGYGCSDHASYNRAGYPSAIPFESSNMHENSKIHTPNDSLDTVNYDHGLQFAKLAVGFVVEMSHP